MVQQKARISDAAGRTVSEFEMRLTDVGVNQAIAPMAPSTLVVANQPPEPAQVNLADGFKAGKVAMEIEAVAGSSGRKLRLVLINKMEASLTVSIPAGEMQFEVDSPVNTLKIANAKGAQISIAAGDKTAPFEVEQRGARGIADGKCALSVYDGTPLFSGSVTMGKLAK